MYFELIILAAVGGFILLFVAVAFLEKQQLGDFVAAPPGGPMTDSPYFNAMNEAAYRLGFAGAGLFVQRRGSKLYQARLALWVSPERDTLLQVYGGKTAGVPIKRTVLISVLEPNRILQTQDEFAAADLSGLTDREIVLNANLDELLGRHRERLGSCSGPARAFSQQTALADWESTRAMKAEEMGRLGLVRFLNREHTAWRHTLRGARLQYQIGFRGQLAEGKAQVARRSRKRPGAA